MGFSSTDSSLETFVDKNNYDTTQLRLRLLLASLHRLRPLQNHPIALNRPFLCKLRLAEQTYLGRACSLKENKIKASRDLFVLRVGDGCKWVRINKLRKSDEVINNNFLDMEVLCLFHVHLLILYKNK